MSERFEMRVHEWLLEKVDRWRRDQRDVPSRSEAMRRLIEAGLSKRPAGKANDADVIEALCARVTDLEQRLGINRAKP